MKSFNATVLMCKAHLKVIFKCISVAVYAFLGDESFLT